MQKQFYICHLATLHENKHRFREAHYVSTDDPMKVMVSAVPHTDADAEFFERLAEVVHCTDEVLADEHVGKLASLKVKKGQTGKDAVKLAEVVHPAFKIR